MSNLPALLQEIAEVAGLDAALKVAEAKGGGRASIPAKLKPTHWLVECVGWETAVKLSDHFTSGCRTIEIEVPLGPAGTIAKARRRMIKLIEEGQASSDAIARATGMSRRTVLRKKARMNDEENGDQGSLFRRR